MMEEGSRTWDVAGFEGQGREPWVKGQPLGSGKGKIISPTASRKEESSANTSIFHPVRPVLYLWPRELYEKNLCCFSHQVCGDLWQQQWELVQLINCILSLILSSFLETCCFYFHYSLYIFLQLCFLPVEGCHWEDMTANWPMSWTWASRSSLLPPLFLKCVFCLLFLQ